MKISIQLSAWLVCCSLLLSGAAEAEGGCPAGQIPYSGTDISSCGPIPGDPGRPQRLQPIVPRQIWTNRWGAFALDAKGNAGGSVNQISRFAAEQAALENCQSNGGTNCKIQSAYGNGCVAVVVAEHGSFINSDTTLDSATQAAMHACTADGKSSCHMYYTACSLPIRLQ